MKVNVNNQAMDTRATTLAQLIDELQLPPTGVAVGIDRRMVPRAAWPDTPLSEGLHLTIIKAACGG